LQVALPDHQFLELVVVVVTLIQAAQLEPAELAETVAVETARAMVQLQLGHFLAAL
jgi:hypothetical protein